MSKKACPMCSGSGAVPVPHGEYVWQNEWLPRSEGSDVFITYVVSCVCTKGRIVEEQWKQQKPNGKTPLTLEFYRDNICSEPFMVMEKTLSERNAKRGLQIPKTASKAKSIQQTLDMFRVPV